MSDLPQPNEGFRWVQAAGLPALVCDPLLEAAAHLFTTRHWPLGTRSAQDDEGWRVVAEGLNLPAARLARVTQVHGTAVVSAAEALSGPREADVIVSNDDAVAVQTADCVPVLLADTRTGVVAAVHAGWRGLAGRAPAAGVAALANMFGTEASAIVAAIGPAIGACCYEVGDEVRQRFADARFPPDRLARWFSERPHRSQTNPSLPAINGDGRPGHWFFDAPLAAIDQLQEAGMNPLRIFAAGLCTASHPAVFCSYRRDGAPAGRMAAAIRSRPRP